MARTSFRINRQGDLVLDQTVEQHARLYPSGGDGFATQTFGTQTFGTESGDEEEGEDDALAFVNVVTETDFETVTGIREVAQSLRLRLGMVRGEDVFFPDAGLPIQQLIGPFEADIIESVIRSEMLKEPKVQSIESVDAQLVDPVTRTARVAIRFTIESGETGDAVVTIA